MHDIEDKEGESKCASIISMTSVGRTLKRPIFCIIKQLSASVSESRFRFRVKGGMVGILSSALKGAIDFNNLQVK